MLCRYLLIIGNVSYKLGEWCVRNWDEISYSLKRVDYGGITRAVTSKFDFYGDAYDLIWDEYSRNYLHAEAYVAFEIANDRHIFNEKHRYRLDFTTLVYDGIILSINAFDDSLSTLIKSKKSTQYEYAVSEIRESVPLHYDRLEMKNMAEWIVTGDTVETNEATYITNTFEVAKFSYPLYITSQEIHTKNKIEIYDVSKQQLDSSGFVPFVKCISDDAIILKIKVELTLLARYEGGVGRKRRLFIAHDMNGRTNVLFNQEISEGTNVIKFEKEIEMSKDHAVYFEIGLGETITLYQPLPTTDKMQIEVYAVDLPADIDVIKPVTILNELLKSMNSGKEGIVGEIDTGIDDRLDNALIVAAESARGLNAKLYTSYRKFENWMNVMFGYVPIVTNNSVKFVHRDSNYTSEKGIEFEDVNSFEYSIADGLIYSQVRVGYEKKEYESINGRDEFRWTNNYNTGLSITDNTLDLISPYRADAYGMEFLVGKRGEDTTDTSSDNDVFFVCAKLSSDKLKYELIRAGYDINGVISPETMFNSMYSPRSILQANKRYLGVASSILKFASSEGNSDVVINGVREQDDFIIDESERLFTAGEVSFKSTIGFDEENLAKICTITKDGIKYEVYPLESTRKYGKYDGTSYKMCVKSILK